LRLAADPQAVEDLRKNPQDALSQSGLSEADQAIILKGDPDLIRITIAKELGVDPYIITPFCFIIIPLLAVTVSITVSEPPP
jgi:hypothetical protein